MADQYELCPVPVAASGYVAPVDTDELVWCPEPLSIALDGYVTAVEIVVVVVAAPAGFPYSTLVEVLRGNLRDERVRDRVACPNDGTPLLSGPNGDLYCPFDGWRPPGVAAAGTRIPKPEFTFSVESAERLPFDRA
jgi:hypothetical protein